MATGATEQQPELLSVKPVEKEQSRNTSLLDLDDLLRSGEKDEQKPVEKDQVPGKTRLDIWSKSED